MWIFNDLGMQTSNFSWHNYFSDWIFNILFIHSFLWFKPSNSVVMCRSLASSSTTKLEHFIKLDQLNVRSEQFYMGLGKHHFKPFDSANQILHITTDHTYVESHGAFRSTPGTKHGLGKPGQGRAEHTSSLYAQIHSHM